MAHYELRLPYFKQGDDLASQLPEGTDQYPTDVTAEQSAAAFLAHAECLEYAAGMLRRCASAAVEHGLVITQADTHFIAVDVGESVGEALVADGLLAHDPFADELEDEETEYSEHDYYIEEDEVTDSGDEAV